MSTLFNDSPECRALPYYLTALEAAVTFDAFQKCMAKEYPGAWPWPVSGMQISPPLTDEQIEQQKALAAGARVHDKSNSLGHQPYASAPLANNNLGGEPYQPQHQGKTEQAFDTEAHRAFMRGLG